MNDLIVLSSLAKVYTDMPLDLSHALKSGTMLINDTYHFQVAFKSQGGYNQIDSVDTVSDLGDAVSIRYVDYVPCDITVEVPNHDTCEHPAPGLFPDILKPLPKKAWAYPDMWRAFWITVDGSKKDLKPGKYPITVSVTCNEKVDSVTFNLEVLPAKLDAQALPVTNWLHCDCICQYHGVEFASEEFWAILKNYLTAAVKNGINMILTPIFTPPLDTEIGGERLTNQLVDVTISDGTYLFNFDNLVRFVGLCRECGVKYYEIAPLFTQWGCKYAPKVMATVDGEYKKIFGWDTEGYGKEYLGFLGEMLPLLVAKLKELEVFDVCYFHISDEPTPDVIDNYKICADFLKEHIPSDKFIDAMRDPEFYKQGYVTVPVAAFLNMPAFLPENIDNLWGYFCCCEQRTANRLLAHASYRNRVLGLTLFKHDIKGFLQWGLNFYNSRHSREAINPYATSTAYGWVPGGDPYVLYPNDDGTVTESLRICVFADAIRDFTALNMLLKKYTREELVKMFELEDLTFFSFLPPHKLLEIRDKVNRMLCE